MDKKYNRVLSKTFFAEIPAGWEVLVKDFIEEIYCASKEYKKNAIKISDIKEKFGGMRIYVDYSLPDEQILEMEKIVSKYEHLSLKTCTICAGEEKQMHTRRGYWDSVLCLDCFNKTDK